MRNYWILQFELYRYQTSAETSNFNFFVCRIWPKTVFPVKSRKSKHHHWILYIQISLGNRSWTPSLNFAYWNPCKYPGCPIRGRFVLAKFLLKLAVLVFWTKFAPLEHFQSKSWTPSLNSTYWNLSSYPGFPMRGRLVRGLPRTPSPTLAKTLVLNFSLNWQFNFLETSALNSAYSN